MNILLIGPQGSGKGTQARILCDKFGYFYFESGAYLRRIAADRPALKESLARGELVPDKEMTSYLEAFLDSKNLYDGIIFDGFPRTVAQYNFLKDWFSEKNVSLSLVINIEVSEKETIRRLSARREDPATGKIYNLITSPPPPGVDKSKLIQREDDKPEAIMERLRLYRERTAPLVELLRKETKVVDVDGERPIEVIAKDLADLVQNDIDIK